MKYTIDDLDSPKRVKFFDDIQIKTIAAGKMHSLALSEDN